MDNQFNESAVQGSNKKITWAIIITFLITAIITSIAIIGYQKYILEVDEQEIAGQEADLLQNKIQQENGEFKDWQTYTNEEYGFEAKYPEDIKINESVGKGKDSVFLVEFISIAKMCDYGIVVEILEVGMFSSLQKWYADFYQQKNEESQLLGIPLFLEKSGEEKQFNNYNSYQVRFFGADCPGISEYIFHNKYIYDIYHGSEWSNDVEWEKNKEIMNQILSTFKFTD